MSPSNNKRDNALIPDGDFNKNVIGPAYKLITLFFLVTLLSACFFSSDETADDSTPNSATSNIDISVNTESVLLPEIGSQYQLEADLTGANNAEVIGETNFTWESNPESVVSVDQAGLVTAVGFGDATITITGENEVKEIDVSVNPDLTTLNGIIRYGDKEYGSSGFTNRSNYFKPVRFAKVEYIGEDGSTLQSTFTDNEGKFSVTGILSSKQSILVHAQTDESQGLKLRVQDRSNAIYAVSKGVSKTDADSFSMDISSDIAAAGAFNILDVFINSAQFTLENSNASLVSLSAFWQRNNNAGTYYCTGYDASYCDQGEGVYVYSSVGSDTDEFDDDVLYHEFGHYFAHALSRDDSYGGCHLLSSKDLDLRLAWSEGWGDFFPAAVKTWLNVPERQYLLSSNSTMPVSAYVDTNGNYAQIYIDVASLDRARYNSAANEMAVAKILLGLMQQYGMPAIVKVLTDYLPTLNNTVVNLESFWDGWLFTHQPTLEQLTILESIFTERGAFYLMDQFESDDDVNNQRKIALNEVETHYLYKGPMEVDIDTVAFDAEEGVQYLLQTNNLTGGADTFIRVLDSAGNKLSINGSPVENDDANPDSYYSFDSLCNSSRVKNNGTALASRVIFTAPSNGTYYAEIRTTTDPEPYLSAGRYGTYNFQISPN